jgi:hypothetical protein
MILALPPHPPSPQAMAGPDTLTGERAPRCRASGAAGLATNPRSPRPFVERAPCSLAPCLRRPYEGHGPPIMKKSRSHQSITQAEELLKASATASLPSHFFRITADSVSDSTEGGYFVISGDLHHSQRLDHPVAHVSTSSQVSGERNTAGPQVTADPGRTTPS